MVGDRIHLRHYKKKIHFSVQYLKRKLTTFIFFFTATINFPLQTIIYLLLRMNLILVCLGKLLIDDKKEMEKNSD
jgi:hypothetical protein